MISIKRLFILFGLALLLAACDAGDRKAAHMQRADAYVAQENYEKARIEYQNALQIDPKDMAARFALAQTLEHLNEWQNAAGQYQAIVNYDAEHAGARIRLGRIYLAARNFDKSLELAQDALRLAPDDLDALALRGASLAKKGDNTQALQDGLAVLEKDPAHKDAVALVASLFVVNKQFEKAISLLEEGTERNPQDASLKLFLGSMYISRNDIERGINVFRNIIKLDPANLGHRVRLAALMVKLDRIADAEQVLQQTVEDNPENTQAKLVLVDFIAKESGKDKAVSAMQGYLSAEPDNEGLLNGLASLYRGFGDIDNAMQAYQTIIDKKISDSVTHDAKVRLAELLFREKELDKAGQLLEEVLLENSRHNEALMIRGSIALAQREPVKAISDFRAILRDQSNVPIVYQKLAAAHMQNQEYEQAVDNMQRAVDLNPDDVKTRAALATLLVQLEKIDQAIEQYRILAQAKKDADQYVVTLFGLLVKKGDMKGATELVNDMEARDPESYLAYMLRGSLLQRTGDLNGSAVALEKALSKAPDNIEVITGLVRTYIGQKDIAKATALLNRKAGEVSDKAAIHNIKGELLVLQNKLDEAIFEFRKATVLKADWPKPYQNMASVQLAQKKHDQVENTYRRGLKATDNDLGLVIRLSAFYENTGAYDKAIAEYENYLANKPGNAPVANNLAMLLVSHKDDEDSLARALELVQPLTRMPEPAYQDTLGWVLYKNDKVDRAIVALEQAVQKIPQATIFNYHLGMAYLAQGNKLKAKQHLEIAVKEKQDYVGKLEAQKALESL